jgi:hypothetical protein
MLGVLPSHLTMALWLSVMDKDSFPRKSLNNIRKIMSPLYLVDFSNKIKTNLTNDLLFLKQGLQTLQVNDYHRVEIEWLITAVERDAHLMKHNIHQLAKHLEKIYAGTEIQDNIRGEHLPPEVCPGTK